MFMENANTRAGFGDCAAVGVQRDLLDVEPQADTS